MTTPADATTAIVVGATDMDGQAIQDYCSRGPAGSRLGPDVVAPGGTALDAIICCVVSGVLAARAPARASPRRT